jgi:hypothetical protein
MQKTNLGSRGNQQNWSRNPGQQNREPQAEFSALLYFNGGNAASRNSLQHKNVPLQPLQI